MQKFLNSFIIIIALLLINNCGGDSNPDVQINKVTFNDIELSIYDDTPIGTILDKKLTILYAPNNIAVAISLSGDGSGDFSVRVLDGNETLNPEDAPNNISNDISANPNPNSTKTLTVEAFTGSYFGNITLLNSLEGKGGTTYILKALATLGQGDIDCVVTINILSRVVNTPPSISIVEDNQTVELNSTVALSTIANDAEGDDIAYQWYYQREGSATKQNGGTLSSFNHIFTDIGVYTVSVTATDTKGDSNTTQRTITVEGIKNKPPVAIIGIGVDENEQNITTWIGAKAEGLEASYSYDLDGSIIQCKWLNQNDNIVKISDNKNCDLLDLIFNSAGSYDYTLSVTDNNGDIDSNIVHITVEDNSIPDISIDGGDKTVEVNSSISFVSNSIDSDGDDIDYWWRSLNIDTNTSAITAIQSFTGGESRFDYNFSSVGLYRVEFHAKDSKGAEVVKSVDVNVTN